jgi:hypothetical protein
MWPKHALQRTRSGVTLAAACHLRSSCAAMSPQPASPPPRVAELGSVRRNVKKPTRIAVEVLGPAFVGTVLLFILNHEEFTHTSGITFRIFLYYLAFAYAFAIVPSPVYAFLMEIWLRRNVRNRLGTVSPSSLLGAAAGCAIMLASEAPVVWIGTLVGLILGAILSLEAAQNEEKA